VFSETAQVFFFEFFERSATGNERPPDVFSLVDFIEEIKQSVALRAQAHGCALTVSGVDSRLAIRANRDLLFSALENMLQNSFKFTLPGTDVTLNAYAVAEHIPIEVKDRCGGLSSDDVDRMFEPFRQNGVDRTGLGLGLSIAHRNVEASGGVLSVRDIPDTGRVFTISLPRHPIVEH